MPGMRGQLAYRTALMGLWWVVLAYLGSIMASFALQYIQVRIMQWVGQQTMYDLRKEIFEHLQRLPMSFFDRSPIGRLVTRATTDVDALNDLFATGVAAMLNDFVLLFALFMRLRWSCGIQSSGPGNSLACAVDDFAHVCFPKSRARRKPQDSHGNCAHQWISARAHQRHGHRAAFQPRGKVARAVRRFKPRAHGSVQRCDRRVLLLLPGGGTADHVGCRAALLDGRPSRDRGNACTIGVLISFIQYAQRFFRPIQDLSEKFNILQAAMAASERIFGLLDEPLTIVSAEKTRSLPAPRGEIEFRNVWFAYNGGAMPKDDEWVLRDVSFHVDSGQTLAIVGHTGAGKTTIIQLLLRFYDIQRGQILLDGVDIREMDLQDLRRMFGIVLQDPFLFTGTLESNVKLGSETISRADTESALREVGLGPFVDSQPLGLDIPVTERGSTLSVGQRQLVSFARALAHNPKFLILDEATSSVDTKTELLIREALNRLLQGRTAMVDRAPT